MDALDFRAVYDFFELVYRSPGGLQGTKFEDGGRVFGDCLKLARVIASPPTPVKPDAPAGHAVPSNPHTHTATTYVHIQHTMHPPRTPLTPPINPQLRHTHITTFSV